MDDPSYIAETWPWLLPWLLFFVAFVAVLRNLYALEQSRRALKRSEAEREKLALEIANLKSPPDVRQARREIFERLKGLLQEVLPDTDLSSDHVFRLVAIGNDSSMWFPPEIRKQLSDLAVTLNGVYVAQRKMSLGPGLLGNEKWQELSEKEGALRIEIASFLTGMTDWFCPHIAVNVDQSV